MDEYIAQRKQASRIQSTPERLTLSRILWDEWTSPSGFRRNIAFFSVSVIVWNLMIRTGLSPLLLLAVFLPCSYAYGWLEARLPHIWRSTSQGYSRFQIPMLLHLFSFILPHRVRKQAFDPPYEELVADWLIAKRYKGKCARCWLTFAFLVRTILMLLDCFRVFLADKKFGIFRDMLPEPVKRWWSE